MATNVDSLLETAKTNALALTTEARDVLEKAEVAFKEIKHPDALKFSDPPGFSPPDRPPSPPQMLGGTFDPPPDPGDPPELDDIPEYDAGSLDSFDKQAPTLNEPSKPSEMSDFTDVPPDPKDIPLPDRPSEFTDRPPDVRDITMPPKPQYDNAVFDGVRPADIGAPPDVSGVAMIQYRSASDYITAKLEGEVDRFIDRFDPQFRTQLAALENKLNEYMSGGETGLSPAAENAIYERSKAKTNAETARVQQDALLTAARRGFTLPSGALMSALQQARQAGADNNATAAREIVVMQAEMNQKNIQFAITQSASLRQTMIGAALNYHQGLVQINAHAIQLAQTVVDSIVKSYGLVVDAYRSRWEGYKAAADVYSSRIRANMAKVEQYKAEIDAEKAKVDADIAKIQGFKAKVDAHTALVETYKANIQGVLAEADVERMKVQIFTAQVQAYAAQTQAKEAEWRAYSAAWAGEESKMKAFSAEAQAYSSKADGFKARVQAYASEVDAVSTKNKGRLDSFRAQVDAYTAEIRGAAEKAIAEIHTNDTALKAYHAGNDAMVSYNQAVADRWRAFHSKILNESKSKFDAEVERVKLKIGEMQGAGELALGIGKVYAGMAESAMSGVTTLVRAEPT